MKKIMILGAVAVLASFLIYGVVSNDTKYSPVGYSLKMDFSVSISFKLLRHNLINLLRAFLIKL